MMEFGLKKAKSVAGSFIARAGSAPNPLADVPVTDSLEVDAAAEMTALMKGFKARKSAEDKRFQQATDSEFWVALCFRSRAHKDAFLKAAGAARLGDKYLDGHQFAELIGINLEV